MLDELVHNAPFVELGYLMALDGCTAGPLLQQNLLDERQRVARRQGARDRRALAPLVQGGVAALADDPDPPL